MKSQIVILAMLAALVHPEPAMSQRQTTFDVRSVDFDLWCQVTQRYSAERCRDRLAEDVKDFEEFRATVERFELDYLKRIQRYQDFHDNLTRDPMQTVQRKQDGLP